MDAEQGGKRERLNAGLTAVDWEATLLQIAPPIGPLRHITTRCSCPLGFCVESRACVLEEPALQGFVSAGQLNSMLRVQENRARTPAVTHDTPFGCSPIDEVLSWRLKDNLNRGQPDASR
jgi:hypothetical protein